VINVTPTAVGIAWKAPTANTKGASISHFVIQIAGAGISFEDKVQKVVSWPNSRDNFVQFQEELKKNKNKGCAISTAGESVFGITDTVKIAKVYNNRTCILCYFFFSDLFLLLFFGL
jgi:hypothetical protein